MEAIFENHLLENVLSILLPRLVDDEGAEALVEPLSTPQQSVLLRKLGRYGSVFFGARNGKYELDHQTRSTGNARGASRRVPRRSAAGVLNKCPRNYPYRPRARLSS